MRSIHAFVSFVLSSVVAPSLAAQTAAPSVGTKLVFTSVSAGSAHFCGLDSEGSIDCWGDGQWGQLGNGSTVSSPFAPVRVASLQRFRQVVAGATHTCALTADGYAYCWGANPSGVMGDATVRDNCEGVPCSTRPMPVAIGFRFDSLTAGFEHTCGLTAGRAYCWGRADAGQLGQAGSMSSCGGVACSAVPLLVADSLRFSSISARGLHTCGVASGSVICWGDNRDGQLGPDVPFGSTAHPVHALTLSAANSVSAGGLYTCGITTTDGAIECWGANDRGRLGVASADARVGRVVAPKSARFIEVSVGGSHTCGLTSIGEAYCWGSDVDNRLGGRSSGSCGGDPCSAEPVRVELQKTLTHVAAGGSTTCATGTDGTIYWWGGRASTFVASDDRLARPAFRGR